MRAVVQRVKRAKVVIDGSTTAEIAAGLLLFVGVAHQDGPADVEYIVNKTRDLRIFPDDDGRMNRSVVDVGGGLLVVSQFTLYADVRKGRRPSFTDAAPPNLGQELVDHFATAVQSHGVAVATGQFGAHMLVSLDNDGPVTVWIDSAELGRD
jgi:D-tyrosyl-tRNA(Tyr) deacylase